VDDEIESCIMTACVPDGAARRSERENVEKRQEDVKRDDESRDEVSRPSFKIVKFR